MVEVGLRTFFRVEKHLIFGSKACTLTSEKRFA
jgi:hypothetical protein